VPKRIFAVLYVSVVMGLTRCYKTTVFYIYSSVTVACSRLSWLLVDMLHAFSIASCHVSQKAGDALSDGSMISLVVGCIWVGVTNMKLPKTGHHYGSGASFPGKTLTRSSSPCKVKS